jgi:hypothetical protein
VEGVDKKAGLLCPVTPPIRIALGSKTIPDITRFIGGNRHPELSQMNQRNAQSPEAEGG